CHPRDPAGRAVRSAVRAGGPPTSASRGVPSRERPADPPRRALAPSPRPPSDPKLIASRVSAQQLRASVVGPTVNSVRYRESRWYARIGLSRVNSLRKLLETAEQAHHLLWVHREGDLSGREPGEIR